jgi:hypothetical protein
MWSITGPTGQYVRLTLSMHLTGAVARVGFWFWFGLWGLGPWVEVEGTTNCLNPIGKVVLYQNSRAQFTIHNNSPSQPHTLDRHPHPHPHIMAAAAPKNSADVSTLALSHVNLAHLTSRTTTSTRHWSGHTLLVRCLCSRSDDQDERFWVGSLTRHITCSSHASPCAGPGEVQEDHHARYRWPGQVRIHFSHAPTPSRERHCFTSKQSKRAPILIHRAGREGHTGPLTCTSSIGIVSTARAQSTSFNPSVWC